MICNRGATVDTFRIAHNVGGGATVPGDYLYYGYTIEAGMTVRLDNLRICMATGDKLKVYAGTANLSFNAYGSERSL
jgi:hypothetical protein